MRRTEQLITNRQWLRRLACVSGITISLAGCYRPYYYAPPMPTYQGPVAPVQTLTPGPSYVPGQTVPGGLQPIPADPSLGSGSTTPFYSNEAGGSSSSPPSTFDNSGGSPVYNPAPNNGSTNPVPTYDDPIDDFLTPEISPNSGTVDEFKIPTNDPQAMRKLRSGMDDANIGLQVEPVAVRPVMPLNPVVSQGVVAPGVNVPPAFEEPTPLTFDEVEVVSQPIKQTTYIPETVGEAKLAPYAYEESTYAWLRGVVRMDPDDGQWTLTYDVQPKPFDDFAGHMTLATDDRLKDLKDNDVVLVEGRISQSQQDRFGKPLYEISEMIKLDVAIK